jgi:hypothetical protein
MKEALKYNWHLIIAFSIILIVTISLKMCVKPDVIVDDSTKEYIDSLLTENKILNALSDELEKKRVEDSINLTKEINYYKDLKRKERIVYVQTKVGGILRDQDTLTCFSDNQLDSVGIISIERDHCYEDRVSLISQLKIEKGITLNGGLSLTACQKYTSSLERRNEAAINQIRKEKTKAHRNRKGFFIAATVALVEGVVLFLK